MLVMEEKRIGRVIAIEVFLNCSQESSSVKLSMWSRGNSNDALVISRSTAYSNKTLIYCVTAFDILVI